MVKSLLALVLFILSGCSSDAVIRPPDKPVYKPAPDVFQSVTPSQQRAIMSGERPDWSEASLPRIQKY